MKVTKFGSSLSLNIIMAKLIDMIYPLFSARTLQAIAKFLTETAKYNLYSRLLSYPL